ncbi:MAG: cytochrome c oxidase subunit 3 [Novosphingobium sp.]
MRTSETRHLPGETGLWVFIFMDLALFALFFVLSGIDRVHNPQVFHEGRQGLLVGVGLINTLVLLTGSWAVAMGTRVVPRGRFAAPWIYGAAFSGLVFLALKTVEYVHAAQAGYAVSADVFRTWYFFLTAYHGFHVAAGMLLLTVVANHMQRETAADERLIEAAGCYWHLVDLLWIGIFAVIYLL